MSDTEHLVAPVAFEPEGGDPPCWAHLFEEHATAAAEGGAIDLAAHADAANAAGAAWTHTSDDLNANLLVYPAHEGVDSHVNSEVDVLLVGIAGEGIVEIDGVAHELRPGLALVIPKGARRGTHALSERFAYLTCHRRRGGLWPRRNPRAETTFEGHAGGS